jgi:pimeloyl-ACP methyl ester carboxylesterase
VINAWSHTHEQRFAGFEEYLARWRAQLTPYSDEAERVLVRTVRYELAPLPDGTYRRRALRSAFEDTWASLLDSDSLDALRKVRCPRLIVHATRPWIDGRPYLSEAIVATQRKAVPHARLFVERQSTHPRVVRDPEPDMVEAVRQFVLDLN